MSLKHIRVKGVVTQCCKLASCCLLAGAAIRKGRAAVCPARGRAPFIMLTAVTPVGGPWRALTVRLNVGANLQQHKCIEQERDTS